MTFENFDQAWQSLSEAEKIQILNELDRDDEAERETERRFAELDEAERMGWRINV